MNLASIRLAMMDKYATISGVNVPQDPLPLEIEDKSIIVFPRMSQSTILSKGRSGSIGTQATGVMQVEYHRRIPYKHLGTTMDDITERADDITELAWKEHAGGKFDGTIEAVTGVSLIHLGALGWNEWTFGVRLEVSFMFLAEVIP